MAVRRLAPDNIQPESFAFSADNLAWAQTVIARYPEGRQASAVIPLLWRAQEQHDYWLPRAAIEYVAQMLGMAKIRVMEVATFYSMFNLEPVGKHFVQLCGTTPCRLRGAEKLIDVCHDVIGEQRHVTSDGQLSWLEVECLGACCNAPMAQINNDYYEDLTPENFRKLLDDLRAGRPVKKGSQVGRVSSEPEGGPFTLTDPALYDGSVVGAWKKRFDEAPAAKVDDKAVAAAAAANPTPAKPGTAPASLAQADTPAHKAARGEAPIDPTDRADASNPEKKA